MESLMNGALLIETTLLSFLLALWMTWLGLSGLLRMLPATNHNPAEIKFVANERHRNSSKRAA